MGARKKKTGYILDLSPPCHRAHIQIEKQAVILAFTPKKNGVSSSKLTCMFWECGRKFGGTVSTQHEKNMQTPNMLPIIRIRIMVI